MKQKIIKYTISIISITLIFYIASSYFFRIDLTSEKRYTLSDYTKKLLGEIDEQVYIKIYLEGDDLPVKFKKLRISVQELLDEFGVFSGKRITYEFINPTESTDKKVRFSIYKQLLDKGLTPIESQEASSEGKTSQKMVFPGVVISYKGKEIGINLLKNDPHYQLDSEQNIANSIQTLEYEFTNALQKLSKKIKPKIAFIEGHNELSEYQVMDMTRILSEYYDVQRGRIGGKPDVLNGFKAVIIAKPTTEFSEQDKFVLDQYVMNGGKILWLIEGTNVRLDSLFVNSTTFAISQSLNIEDQLFKYGIRINPDLICDKQSSPIGIALEGEDGQPKIKLYPWYFFPVIVTNNQHSISKYLNFIKTEFVSSIDTVSYDLNIKKTVLLTSSEYTKIRQVPVQINLSDVSTTFNEKEYTQGKKSIAVLLEGKFQSIFNNRPIKKYFPTNSDIKSIDESNLIR